MPGADKSRSFPPALVGWTVWGIGALLYAIGFFMRTAPAVMTTQLMATFNITATELGQLAASFFYAYVLMQIPTGMLSRMFGPRKLLTAGAFVTALGTFVFAFAGNFFVASIGLLLVGGAVGVAIVLAIELSGRWLPKTKFALASGLTMVVGVVGAFAAGMPLSLLVSVFGWQRCMLLLGIVTATLGIVAWIFVRDDPAEKGYQSYSEPKETKNSAGESMGLWKNLVDCFLYRNTWLMLIIPPGLIGAMLSFTGLWGVPYLKVRFGLPVEQAALICSAMLIAFAISSPIVGYLSDRQRRRKPTYVIGVIAGTVCWLAAIVIAGLPLWIVAPLLVGAAAFSGAMPLSYALGRESAPTENSGLVTGVVVTGIMIGPAIIQPVTGWLIDLNWHGAVQSGIRIYDAESFQTAFIPMLGWLVLASLLAPTVKETFCGDKA